MYSNFHGGLKHVRPSDMVEYTRHVLVPLVGNFVLWGTLEPLSMPVWRQVGFASQQSLFPMCNLRVFALSKHAERLAGGKTKIGKGSDLEPCISLFATQQKRS